MRNFSGIFVLSLVLFVVVGGFGAFASGQRAAPAAATLSPTGPVTYPINSDATITYWSGLEAKVTQYFTNNSELPLFQYLEKRTGIKVEFLHPPLNSADEQFNLIIASGDMPDIMQYQWGRYPGGMGKAAEDKIILKLNDVMRDYGPNISAYYRANPAIETMVKTDDGSFYVFPQIRRDPVSLIYNGPYIRKDWLDEVGLPMPETIDEWTAALTAFKEKKGSPAPLSYEYNGYYENNAWSLAYMAPGRFFLLDGKIQYGPMLDGRREFLRLFNQWYKSGLLDPDLVSMTQATVAQKMVSSTGGASFGALAGRLGAWVQTAERAGTPINMLPAPYPVLRKGDKPKMTACQLPYDPNGGAHAVITTNSERWDIAARYLDYGYGEQGHMDNNFGIEGESYRMVDGYPLYTDLLLKNPKYPIDTAVAMYSRGALNGPSIQDGRYQEQLFNLQIQKDGAAMWSIPGMTDYLVPPVSPTLDESLELARIMNEINTHMREMETRFILGQDPLTDTNWNNYVASLKQMGIERALELQNASLARYNSR